MPIIWPSNNIESIMDTLDGTYNYNCTIPLRKCISTTEYIEGMLPPHYPVPAVILEIDLPYYENPYVDIWQIGRDDYVEWVDSIYCGN